VVARQAHLWHDAAVRLSSVLKLSALAALAGAAAVWHHLHMQYFLTHVHDTLAKRLPKRLRTYQWRSRSSILQVYFGEPSMHYEVWVQRKTGQIEVGLHFEGEREENYRWAAALSPRALEIQAQLGPQVELEEWTQKWTRLHEQRPFGGREWKPSRDLSEELAEEIGERLARFIEVLEPIVAKERANVVVAKPRGKKQASSSERPRRKTAGSTQTQKRTRRSRPLR
jgi:hypothetical protein